MDHQQCDCSVVLPASDTTLSELRPALHCGNSTQFFTFMVYLELLLRSQCDVADPCRPLRIDRTDALTTEFDFIVIGSGAAGAVIAGRLSEANGGRHRVLLIEAGGHQHLNRELSNLFSLFESTPIFDWDYSAIPNDRSYLNNVPVRWQSGKVLGGSTAINGQVYMRGTHEDFDQWARLGNPGWSFADVLPYFRRAEDHRDIENVDSGYHETGGPVAVSEYPRPTQLIRDCMRAAEKCGFDATDLNGANSSGAMFMQSTTLNGIRMGTSRAYLHPAWNRTNLHIRINTQATRVLIDPITTRAFGVEAVDLTDGRQLRLLASKEVIVAAGTIESPKLLMHSGIGPADHLREFNITPVVNLAGVGENVQNHPAIVIEFVATNRTHTTLDREAVKDYIRLRESPLNQMLSRLFVRFSSQFANSNSGGGSDVLLTFVSNFYWAENVCPSSKNKYRALILSGFSNCMRPYSRGQIRLASGDPLQQPIIFPNDLNDSRDVEVLLEGVRNIERMMRADSMAEYGLELRPNSNSKACAGFEWRSDAYWRCVIRQETIAYGHHSGSCKMAPPDDPGRVVDHELRVYGVDGLRVIDASIMPLIVAGNTMATTTMIGEKGAQMILDAWT